MLGGLLQDGSNGCTVVLNCKEKSRLNASVGTYVQGQEGEGRISVQADSSVWTESCLQRSSPIFLSQLMLIGSACVQDKWSCPSALLTCLEWRRLQP